MGQKKRNLAGEKIIACLDKNKIGVYDGSITMLILAIAGLVELEQEKEDWLEWFSHTWDLGEEAKVVFNKAKRRRHLKVVK